MAQRHTDLSALYDAYPDTPTCFSRPLSSVLFDRARLVTLAKTLEPHLVEYNRGDLPKSIAAEDVPVAGLPPEAVIEQIGTCNSWMTLRNIENDADYAALVEAVLAEVAAGVEEKTGAMLRREAFLFISSPGAVTPFHFDEEHNILIQIEGDKTVTVFSQYDRDLASQEDLERFHAGGHRNLTLATEHEDRGQAFSLSPGKALYIPPLAPHWVTVTGDAPALSLSVTWRSEKTIRDAYLHQINHGLRQRGRAPRFPGIAPAADQLKIWRQSALRRLGLTAAKR